MKPTELTDDLRPGLRLQAAWVTCSIAWLNSVSPSEAREWLEADKESLLRHLDSLTWQTLLIVLETEQTPDDWAEALKQTMPPMEETDEEEAPLTKAENARLGEIIGEANQGE